MIKLTLPDGSSREIEAAQSAAEIIKGIGMGLYKAACCVKINGEVDLSVSTDTVLSRDKTLLVLADRRISGGDLMKFAAVARRNGVARILFAGKSEESAD